MSWDEIRKRYSTEHFMKRNMPIIESDETPIFLENSNDYSYIYKLMLNPVSDGRHRILWLIIAPFTVNILHLSEEEAIEVCREYIRRCQVLSETDAMEDVEYHVRRAKMISLFPPKLETLKRNHEDLYEIVCKVLDR
ncbi:MAG: DNA primase noncatalytic subunit PriX [Fervidobacterium sp.]